MVLVSDGTTNINSGGMLNTVPTVTTVLNAKKSASAFTNLVMKNTPVNSLSILLPDSLTFMASVICWNSVANAAESDLILDCAESVIWLNAADIVAA